ncbi:MAG: MFS transporter [Gammaproteobacteria bacterium]|nr:MFS transporter [Gammaproteobacteria bacterium]
MNRVIIERLALLGVVGAEYYDFIVMALLAPYLSQVFFPAARYAWLSILVIYAVGALCRPIGAIFWGHFGDKISRKRSLIWTALFMFIASFLIACLPGSRQAGTFAIFALLILRMAQGFALGGDSSAVATLMVEKSVAKWRGFQLSFVCSANCIGGALAGLVVYLLTRFLSHQQMLSFGWRLPFLLGALLLVICLIFRARLSESSMFEAETIRHRFPVAVLLKRYYKMLMLGVAIGALGNALVGLCMFLPTYLHVDYHWQPSQVSFLFTLSLLFLALLYPVIGFYSDKLRRKRLLLFSSIVFLLLLMPLFLLLGQHNFIEILLFILLVKTFTGLGIMCAQCIYTEIFPTHVRVTGVGIVNNFSSGLGGTVPALLSSLVIVVGAIQGPILLLAISALVTLVTTIILHDRTGDSLALIT